MTNQEKITRASKGDLVQIHIVVLHPDKRSPALPEATRVVPYEGWVKGYLLDDQAVIGDTVKIESLIGRELTGVLSDINPIYDHNFGEPQPSLSKIEKNAIATLMKNGKSQ